VSYLHKGKRPAVIIIILTIIIVITIVASTTSTTKTKSQLRRNILFLDIQMTSHKKICRCRRPVSWKAGSKALK
jgi:hypothetical protein